MIDITREKMRTISEAAKVFPGNPAICTIWRWGSKGINGIRLDTLKCGGKWFTSDEAIERFIERCTAAADDDAISADPVVSQDSDAVCKRRLARVDAELEARGLGLVPLQENRTIGVGDA